MNRRPEFPHMWPSSSENSIHQSCGPCTPLQVASRSRWIALSERDNAARRLLLPFLSGLLFDASASRPPCRYPRGLPVHVTRPTRHSALPSRLSPAGIRPAGAEPDRRQREALARGDASQSMEPMGIVRPGRSPKGRGAGAPRSIEPARGTILPLSTTRRFASFLSGLRFPLSGLDMSPAGIEPAFKV